jgi:hypothetical protein
VSYSCHLNKLDICTICTFCIYLSNQLKDVSFSFASVLIYVDYCTIIFLCLLFLYMYFPYLFLDILSIVIFSHQNSAFFRGNGML